MQSHLGIETPSLEEYEKAIVTYSDLGIKVSITELDISALPSPWGTSANISDVNKYRKELDPYKTGLTQKLKKYGKIVT
jgi:endo-1,4-beta-xylanase